MHCKQLVTQFNSIDFFHVFKSVIIKRLYFTTDTITLLYIPYQSYKNSIILLYC